MPDWFYRTCARPALFSLPDAGGRAVALGVIGTLGRSTAGRAVIEFMGHMSPGSDLTVSIGELKFASPIGLGWRVDPERRATRGLDCFGVGCIEVHAGGSRSVVRVGTEVLRDSNAVVSSSDRRTVLGPCQLLVRSVAENGDERVQLPDGLTLPVLGPLPPAP